ncbi:hypothetical protein [Nonomuraea gerenzanensis]|uniref:Uncharacterized protein n=1 Tax=Nonomuraea gerenzanensis TaxID=93944 RepID=A0A1M4EMM0_9ACTN|nr:hypothetical protein [Nonomuraea gerenzanensis]UBU11597.1 hypothetical protein LCN96_46040 [Nonomuraea gerenzanensis]SBP00092.1 hypothetical protein BN4615_P9608 [Nonomuraea gerenzanensis]
MPNISDGELVRGVDFPRTVQAQDDTIQNGTASTAYVAGSPEVGVYFTAPTSGRVLITVGGGSRDATNDNRAFLASQVFVRDSSGTEVLAPSVESYGWSAPGSNSDYVFGSRVSLLTGLTPGQVYYARVMMSPEGTTVQVKAREIVVEPTS